jgi:hypothetical protein
MAVRPQLYNELFRADSVEECPRCHRIIYLEEAVLGKDAQETEAEQDIEQDDKEGQDAKGETS